MSAEITIARPPAVWRDRLRAYELMVDGYPVASVNPDESETVPVVAGHHSVWVKIDWCRSDVLDVDLCDGERAVLTCRPNGPLLLGVLFSVFLRTRYLSIQLERIERPLSCEPPSSSVDREGEQDASTGVMSSPPSW